VVFLPFSLIIAIQGNDKQYSIDGTRDLNHLFISMYAWIKHPVYRPSPITMQLSPYKFTNLTNRNFPVFVFLLNRPWWLGYTTALKCMLRRHSSKGLHVVWKSYIISRPYISKTNGQLDDVLNLRRCSDWNIYRHFIYCSTDGRQFRHLNTKN